MENENAPRADALADYDNVKVIVSLHSLGVPLLKKELSGRADDNIKLNFKLGINLDTEIIEGLVKQRDQLLAALKEIIVAYENEDPQTTGLMDLLVCGEDIIAARKAIAAVEQPQSVADFLADKAPVFRVNGGEAS